MVANAKVMIVDDVPSFLEETEGTLREAGINATTCPSPLKALERLKNEKIDLLLTTLVMRELGGFELIRQVRGMGLTLPIVMVTGYGSQEAAVEAIRLGCSDYLNKPVAAKELVSRVRRALEQMRTRMAGKIRFDQMVSQDVAMKAVFETVEMIASTRSRVLILGETGTGKQLLAHAIHARSARKAEPFVGLNCAAIPENLLESELFGHERGAFTDAHDQRIGRFEQAGNGTLFLDEIGEVPVSLQAKLLHVLESGEYTRVGGEKVHKSEARIIAATNRDLASEVQAGRFRADLFYRLNVINIVLPPLRDRPADIPLLVEHFIAAFTPAGDRPIRLTPDAMQVLQAHHWTGNVRELQNLIERLVVLMPGRMIHPSDLPLHVREPAIYAHSHTGLLEGAFRDARNRFEYAYLRHVIEVNHGNLAAAARFAGLDRAQFYRLAQRHGLTTSV